MKPIAIIGGTFLLWIAARGRFNLYAALASKGDDASTSANPGTSGASAAASNSLPSELGAAANSIHDLFNSVWTAFKTV